MNKLWLPITSLSALALVVGCGASSEPFPDAAAFQLHVEQRYGYKTGYGSDNARVAEIRVDLDRGSAQALPAANPTIELIAFKPGSSGNTGSRNTGSANTPRNGSAGTTMQPQAPTRNPADTKTPAVTTPPRVPVSKPSSVAPLPTVTTTSKPATPSQAKPPQRVKVAEHELEHWFAIVKIEFTDSDGASISCEVEIDQNDGKRSEQIEVDAINGVDEELTAEVLGYHRLENVKLDELLTVLAANIERNGTCLAA